MFFIACKSRQLPTFCTLLLFIVVWTEQLVMVHADHHEWVVYSRRGITDEELRNCLSASPYTKVSSGNVIHSSGRSAVLSIRAETAQDVYAALMVQNSGYNQLQQEQFVIALNQNVTKDVATAAIVSPSSQEYYNTMSWGLDRVDQRVPPLDGKYRLLHGAGDLPATIHVYPVDTGISSHASFDSQRLVLAEYNYFQGQETPYDCDGHGTHVAGIIASLPYGVAKHNTVLHSIKVLDCTGSGTILSVMSGLNYVRYYAQRPAVVNLSIGASKNTALEALIDDMIADNIAIVCSAGNNNVDACLRSPSGAKKALTVGASDRNNYKASFSNYGTCVDGFAPGVDILSTYKDQQIAYLSGTSMSSPFVAGICALLWSQNTSMSATQVMNSVANQASFGVLASANLGSGSPNKLFYSLVLANASAPATTTPPPVTSQPNGGGGDTSHGAVSAHSQWPWRVTAIVAIACLVVP